MSIQEDESILTRLKSASSDLKSLLEASKKMENSLQKMGNRFTQIDDCLSITSKRLAPLHSLSVAAKALETRINRAVSPALLLLDTFKLTESLQTKILAVSSELSAEEKPKKRLKLLLKFVDCVDKLNAAINTISQDGEPVIQKLQEVVEFLSRTKATDQYRAHRLRETLVTLKALFETEVDAVKFDGLLDEALLNLQDDFEGILLQLKHQNIDESREDNDDESDVKAPNSDLASAMEIKILRRISETLAANDCLDICIDVFLKVRYKRAAKALMRLNPDYLRTYNPEEIDGMEWENLETSISLWIQHFQLAVRTVLLSEKKLTNQVLGGLMNGAVWMECFVKIADKIMAVFFRFGEGVARSDKEPQKLFKLLDMFDSLEKLKTEVSEIFEGEAGADICTRFRELEKLLINASSKVFWEFGLKIEGNSDGLPPPQDGSVPKLVRYAINYLKYLCTGNYSAPMAKVLRTEQIWKVGILSKPEPDESLLNEALTNIMEALKRNTESKRLRYRDKVLPHVFAMNTYWYIYMRTRNTELGKLLGEQYLKQNYKVVTEESAYMYQRQVWMPLVRILEKDQEVKIRNSSTSHKEMINVNVVRGKIVSFLKGFDEIAERHSKESGYAIPDGDLRVQIGEATVNLLVPAYAKFLELYGNLLELEGVEFVSPETIQEALDQIFNCGDRVGDVKMKRRDTKDIHGELKDFRRSRSNNSDL
ncbi:exocyst complex component EXO70I-like [Mercurialis annua]|uniref:exocyst complex component EXO70I-like n=1 Tax=Mercurialis annua TaxID=3986 RepID=UPI00215F3725|nr:exocyst complex component EXO70I-like [Mercurialis annua]